MTCKLQNQGETAIDMSLTTNMLLSRTPKLMMATTVKLHLDVTFNPENRRKIHNCSMTWFAGCFTFRKAPQLEMSSFLTMKHLACGQASFKTTIAMHNGCTSPWCPTGLPLPH